MQTQLIKSTLFFQQLLSSRFRTLKERVVKTIMLLSLCHLFGLYNPNQVSDALFIPKASLYRHLNEVSLYQWQHLFVHIGCSVALQEIRNDSQVSAFFVHEGVIRISTLRFSLFRITKQTFYSKILKIHLLQTFKQGTSFGSSPKRADAFAGVSFSSLRSRRGLQRRGLPLTTHVPLLLQRNRCPEIHFLNFLQF